MPNSRRPKQARSRETYERLLSMSQEVLADVGIEKFNSNLVVERLGVTPPAFYRYFPNKYAVLEELANRLMAAQNDVLKDLQPASSLNVEDLIAESRDSLKLTLEATRAFVGGYVLLVSLRAIEEVRPIRLESHNQMAELLAQRIQKFGAKGRPQTIKAQARMAVEIGYGAVEMLFETNFHRESDVLEAAARAILSNFEFED